MNRTWKIWIIVVMGGLYGCSAGGAGSESQARQHLDAEFRKWMSGQENEVITMMSEVQGHMDPIGYSIRSVVPDEPHYQCIQNHTTIPSDWKTWPAFRFNVAIEKKSQAETPLTKITTYTLTWNPIEKKWYTQERF